MEVTTRRRDLLELLGKLSIAMPRNSVLPVLRNFHVRAEKDSIRVLATDLDVELSGHCKARIATEGGTLLPKKAVEFLKASRTDEVTLTLVAKRNRGDGGKMVTTRTLRIQAGTAETSVPLLGGVEDYPPTLTDKGVRGHRVIIDDLVGALRQVAYAAAE